MKTISVNQENCTKCLHCVKVCPADIFIFDKEQKQVGVQHPQICIGCGHCVASCDSDAVIHCDFPAEKVHPLDYSRYPAPQQMMELLHGRRSNRAFRKQPVPEEMLTQIAEAAYLAPTATNLQELEFTLVTDPAKLKVLTEFTLETFAGILKKINNPLMRAVLKKTNPTILRYIPVFQMLQREYAAGRDGILRDAPAVLLIHAAQQSGFLVADSNLAYQNGSLMAESLGVSQFYAGFLISAIGQRKGVLESRLGIEGTIHAGMALGIPAFRMNKYTDRKPMRLNRI